MSRRVSKVSFSRGAVPCEPRILDPLVTSVVQGTLAGFGGGAGLALEVQGRVLSSVEPFPLFVRCVVGPLFWAWLTSIDDNGDGFARGEIKVDGLRARGGLPHFAQEPVARDVKQGEDGIQQLQVITVLRLDDTLEAVNVEFKLEACVLTDVFEAKFRVFAEFTRWWEEEGAGPRVTRNDWWEQGALEVCHGGEFGKLDWGGTCAVHGRGVGRWQSVG